MTCPVIVSPVTVPSIPRLAAVVYPVALRTLSEPLPADVSFSTNLPPLIDAVTFTSVLSLNAESTSEIEALRDRSMVVVVPALFVTRILPRDTPCPPLSELSCASVSSRAAVDSNVSAVSPVPEVARSTNPCDSNWCVLTSRSTMNE